MPVTLLNGPLHADYEGDKRFNQKPPNKRRVFIQTENGCVVGMELERNDNAHTLKRRMQLTLNHPTDQTSLTFGDKVLNHDLSAIKHDSALFSHQKLNPPKLFNSMSVTNTKIPPTKRSKWCYRDHWSSHPFYPFHQNQSARGRNHYSLEKRNRPD